MNDKSRSLLDELEKLQQVLDDAASEPGSEQEAGDFSMDDIPLLDDVFDDDWQQPDTADDGTRAAVVSINADSVVNSKAPASEIPTLKAVPTVAPAAEVKPSQQHAINSDEAVAAKVTVLTTASTANDSPNSTAPSSAPLLSAADLLGLGDDEQEGPDIIDMLEQIDDDDSDEPAASGANPFLPASILERLAQERAAAQADAQQAHQTLIRPSESRTPPANHDLLEDVPKLTEQQKQALLDDLVEEMLPTLRYKLRQRLKQLLYS